MRRTMLLCAVLALACSSEKPANSDSANMAAVTPPPPPALTLAELAGTWEGVSTAANDTTVLSTQVMTATADTSGWKVTIANAKTPTKTLVVTPTRVVAAGDSLIVEAGPYESVLRPGVKVSTHSIYRLQGGKLVGVTHATYPNEMVMLSSTLTRKM